MIRGRLSADLRAMIPITVGPAGRARQNVWTTIDTGFSGFLGLPEPLATSLGLPFIAMTPVRLANGAVDVVRSYEARAQWFGTELEFQVVETGIAILGVMLLRGWILEIEF